MMKFIPEVGDMVLYRLNNGTNIGGTIESFDGPNQILSTTPEDFEALDSSDIKSASFGPLYPQCKRFSKELFDELLEGSSVSGWTSGVPSSTSSPLPKTQPLWSSVMKKWNHPGLYSCSCDPNCKGGWSDFEKGPV